MLEQFPVAPTLVLLKVRRILCVPFVAATLFFGSSITPKHSFAIVSFSTIYSSSNIDPPCCIKHPGSS